MSNTDLHPFAVVSQLALLLESLEDDSELLNGPYHQPLPLLELDEDDESK